MANGINSACVIRWASVPWTIADSNTYAHIPPETDMRVARIMGLFNMSPRLTDSRVAQQFHLWLDQFSEGSGQSNSQHSFQFPPLPPSSRDFPDVSDISTSHPDPPLGDAVPQGSQVQDEPALASPSVSLSSPWGPLSSVHGANRVFLDVCCGVNRPLSDAVLKLGGDSFSFDVLIKVSYDIFDDVMFERLLRICASGIVGYKLSTQTETRWSPSIEDSRIS